MSEIRDKQDRKWIKLEINKTWMSEIRDKQYD